MTCTYVSSTHEYVADPVEHKNFQTFLLYYYLVTHLNDSEFYHISPNFNIFMKIQSLGKLLLKLNEFQCIIAKNFAFSKEVPDSMFLRLP